MVVTTGVSTNPDKQSGRKSRTVAFRVFITRPSLIKEGPILRAAPVSIMSNMSRFLFPVTS